MPWMLASLLSALFLGFYDLAKKHAVRENAVLPVLFLSTAVSAAVWLALMAAEGAHPGCLPQALRVEDLSPARHGLMMLKALVVGLSWCLSYFALKHLPVTLAAPVRATGPVWTLCGALLLLGERPSPLEAVGVLVTLGSFVGLSFAGRRDGVVFHRNKWVGWMVAGTLFSAVSALFDKYLLGSAGFSAAATQAWFNLYLALFLLPLAVGWKRRWWPRAEFEWRWSIPLIGCFLLVADFVYFDALRDPEALISLVSSLRRGSVLVAFIGGLWLFREQHGRHKALPVLGILAGILLTLNG